MGLFAGSKSKNLANFVQTRPQQLSPFTCTNTLYTHTHHTTPPHSTPPAFENLFSGGGIAADYRDQRLIRRTRRKETQLGTHASQQEIQADSSFPADTANASTPLALTSSLRPAASAFTCAECSQYFIVFHSIISQFFNTRVGGGVVLTDQGCSSSRSRF